ncbi:MAG: DUF4238 domain-containing protein [Polyangiaceae bacterium]|nr:DUF4238 domain-containing protein [Polyangiaceae bacterium]
MSEPKLHHYVPQFYLKRFADERGRVWVWDKLTRKVYRAAPSGISAQTHFYRVPEFIGTDVDPLFLEKDLSALEGDAASIWGSVMGQLEALQPQQKLTMPDEERHVISTFIAVQFLRSAEQRDILALFSAECGAYAQVPAPDEQINLHAQMLCSGGLVEAITKRVHASIWVYARNGSDTPLWTSDNPVAFKTGDNRMWLKGPGIFQRGTYVVFPLSPKYVLYCKEPEHWSKLAKFESSLSPVLLDSDMVKHENAGQVFMATRHVVSTTDDFAWADEFAATIGTDTYAPDDTSSADEAENT